MSHPYRQLLCAAAVASALVAPLAHADTVIDFEPAALTGLYLPGDTFTQGDYKLTTQLDFGVIDTAAALGAVAPTGNATQFYFNSNDGRLVLERSDGGIFALVSFSAAFVPLDPASAQPTAMMARYTTDNGSVITTGGNFAPSNTSNFPFNTRLGGPSAESIVKVEFYACSYVAFIPCTEPTLNNGQFAIDDINVSVVPEPASALLLALGLLGLGLNARRTAR